MTKLFKNDRPNIDDLRCVFLPGKCFNDSGITKLHDRTFSYWEQFWNDVFIKNGASERVASDSFCRQDIINTLVDSSDRVVAMHLYSLYDIRSLAQLSHSYFKKSFTDTYINALMSADAKYVMSMEYLTVDPNWRKSLSGISLAAVLVGLACQIQQMLQVDALIGPSRADLKVTRLAEDYNGDVLEGPIMMHNTPVDLIAIFKQKASAHPDPAINSFVRHLWGNRTDYSGFLKNLSSLNKITSQAVA